MENEIIMTPEEEKRFYELKSHEDACFRTLSGEVISELELSDEKFEKYIKTCEEELTFALTESHQFLNELKKKYNLYDGFMVKVNKIIPNPPED